MSRQNTFTSNHCGYEENGCSHCSIEDGEGESSVLAPAWGLTTIDGLRRQQQALDQRAEETRQNLRAIRKDARAGALRAKLTQRLEEFTEEANRIGREILTLLAL